MKWDFKIVISLIFVYYFMSEYEMKYFLSLFAAALQTHQSLCLLLLYDSYAKENQFGRVYIVICYVQQFCRIFLCISDIVVSPCRSVSWPGSADSGLWLRESGLPVAGPAASLGPTGAREPTESLRTGGGVLTSARLGQSEDAVWSRIDFRRYNA